MTIKSFISRSVLTIVGIGVIGAVGLHFYQGPTSTIETKTAGSVDNLIKKGEYLARLGDCTSCHTGNENEPFAGGVSFDLPIGTIFTPNITPDKTYGIGNYTLQDFDNAVRFGIRKDGASLYPAMPFPDYSVISEDDIRALYTYFMQGVKPLAIAPPKEEITWPLSMRWPLTAWRLIFSPTPEAFDAGKYADPEIARGAYLVQGLGHCSSCHTPRGFALNEEAYNDSNPKFLMGSNVPVDGWMPINLRGDDITGLGGISTDDLATLLWTGRSEHNAVFGGMREVIDNSLQYATKEDITAMAKYLKTLPPVNPQNPPYVYNDATHQALASGNDSMIGASTYIDACATCHRTDGMGYSGVFPALAGNPAVQAESPLSVIKIITSGSILNGTHQAVTEFVMPNESDRFSDEDIANLATFIRTSWGNQGQPVTIEEVKQARNSKGL
ncbi:c-type cytochrome [Ignatzschineria sp. LJL83]